MLKVMRPELLDRLPFERFQDAQQGTGSIADIVDPDYYNQLLEDAAQTIDKFGSFEEFVK
jgi:hypothetical protein